MPDIGMFSFWSRKGNKSPAAGPSSNVFPQVSSGGQGQSQDVELSSAVPRPVHLSEAEVVVGTPQATQADVVPERILAPIANPHDAAVAEVHAKLLQAEQMSSASTARPPPPSDPLTEPAAAPASHSHPTLPAEVLYDPATGAQRGVFEHAVVAGTGGSGGGLCESEQLRDEVWAHLARIREIQSEIAMMHMHMEGVGDGAGSIDVEVDNDIDVDTVPTEEEEDAARRAREFEKLPGRFKGRSDNIDAMMAKLDELSQAVASFHALQLPPLSSESTLTSRNNTDSSASPGDPSGPVAARTRMGVVPAAMFGSKAVLDQQHALHDSPVSAHSPFSADVPGKS